MGWVRSVLAKIPRTKLKGMSFVYEVSWTNDNWRTLSARERASAGRRKQGMIPIILLLLVSSIGCDLSYSPNSKVKDFCEKIAGSLGVIIIIIVLMMNPSIWAFVFSLYIWAANTGAIYSFCIVVTMQRQFSSFQRFWGRKWSLDRYYESTRHSNMSKVSSPCKFVQRWEFSFYFKFKNKQQQANKRMRNTEGVSVIVFTVEFIRDTCIFTWIKSKFCFSILWKI